MRAWNGESVARSGWLGGRPGAAIRRSDASTQFTKLRSGPTRSPLRALSKPTTPIPMPAPTPDRRRHVHKSESFLHHLRDRAGIVSCRSSAGEVPLWGPQTGTPPALPPNCHQPAHYRNEPLCLAPTKVPWGGTWPALMEQSPTGCAEVSSSKP